MFLEFYGLRDQPFGVTPDPRYLYFSSTHREALGSLFYGIETGCGFLALIAPPGVGKTTLLTHLMEKLQSSAQTAFLFHTQCNSREFLSQLLLELGVDCDDQNLAHMYEALQAVLLRNARTGRRFVLVIDEAQNLSDSVLETVRLLSDFETPQSKLMQIVLCGQPQLADRLAHPGLTQLRQRISIVSKLQPLTSAESLTYIDYRMLVAGHSGVSPFSHEAIKLITTHSAGIPRNINNICFNALTLGCSKRQKQLDVAIVHEVVADLDLEALSCSNKLTADASPGLSSSFGELEPSTEQRYPDFDRAVRTAWEMNAGNRKKGQRLHADHRVRGLAGPVAAVPKSQQAMQSSIIANLPGTPDSTITTRAVALDDSMPDRPTTLPDGEEFQSEKSPAVVGAEPQVPSRSVDPARNEPNHRSSDTKPATVLSTSEPMIPINATLQDREELPEAILSAYNESFRAEVDPTGSEQTELPESTASTDASDNARSQRRIPVPATPESQLKNKLGLTEVLTSYYGSSLSSRIVGPLRFMRGSLPAPSLEA